jgi:hypothetical protein
VPLLNPARLLIICSLALSSISCDYIGPPPEPSQIKADQEDALAFLKSLPHATKRDFPPCTYLSNGIRNISGEIIPYEQFSLTISNVKRETFISLLRPSQRQYLAIPTSSGTLNNECIAYRFVKQQEYAFYWGKDRKQELSAKVVKALRKLGVQQL